MNLTCPQCQALYDITRDVSDAVFVCHQCGQEFSSQAQAASERQPELDLAQPCMTLQWQSVSRGFAAPPWQDVDIFAPSADSEEMAAFKPVADASCDDAEAVAGSQPQAVSSDHGNTMPVEAEPAPIESEAKPVETELAPVRKTAHIWPWLLTMLMLLAGAGFWVQKDAWLDNRRVRSTLMNIGIDMPLRAKDWRIAPASVSPEWLSRDDGGRMLRIRGNIKNLLGSDSPLPRINLIFFSKTEPDNQIASTMLEMILTPSDKQLAQAPYNVPARDTMPVPALGNRTFTIIAESVPEKTGDFTLTPVPR